MRKELKVRLASVQRSLKLIARLRKVALDSEEALIDRMAERSKKVLLDLRGKVFRVSKQVGLSLDNNAQAEFAQAVQDILSVVSDAGVVDQAKAEEMRSAFDSKWKKVSQATRGATPVAYYFNALERFASVALLASLLQNQRIVERAKREPKVRDKLYSVVEKMAEISSQVQTHLSRATSALPSASAPEAAPAKDSTSEEAVTKQLQQAEEKMRGVVSQLGKFLLDKAEEVWDSPEMSRAMEENIFSIFNGRKVDPKLNRDREFYKDALHLQNGSSLVDLGDFLDTKKKKAVYLAYRSFVMATRALGVVQVAKANPEIVMRDPKVQEMVVKAQDILLKRKDTIVSYLKALNKAKLVSEPKESKGIPKGTFSDFFEN